MVVETRKVKKIPPLSRRLTQLFHSGSPDLGRWNRNTKKLCSDPNVFIISNFLSESEIQYFDQIITQHSHQFRSSYTEGANNDADDILDSHTQQEQSGNDSPPEDRDIKFDDIDDASSKCDVLSGIIAPSSSSRATVSVPSNTKRVMKVYSEERTSTYIHLTKSQDGVVRSIERKAADLLGLDVSNVEPLQIVHYENGQQFTVHHDAGTLNSEDGEIVDVIEPKRLVTFFAYLNNLPENEGSTEFPSLKLKVQPIRGSAVLFCNMLPDGTADKRTIHSANPVSFPLEKYGLNIWVCDQNLHDFTYMPVKIKLNSKRPAAAAKENDPTSAMIIKPLSILEEVEEKTNTSILNRKVQYPKSIATEKQLPESEDCPEPLENGCSDDNLYFNTDINSY